MPRPSNSVTSFVPTAIFCRVSASSIFEGNFRPSNSSLERAAIVFFLFAVAY